LPSAPLQFQTKQFITNCWNWRERPFYFKRFKPRSRVL